MMHFWRLLFLFITLKEAWSHKEKIVLQRRKTKNKRPALQATLPDGLKRRLQTGSSPIPGTVSPVPPVAPPIPLGPTIATDDDTSTEVRQDNGNGNGGGNGDGSNAIGPDGGGNEGGPEGGPEGTGAGAGDPAPGPRNEFPHVELSDYYNNEFVGNLGVGSPPQYFTVVFDTGHQNLSHASSHLLLIYTLLTQLLALSINTLVVVDTGSSDIWLPGDKCKNCENHKNFDSTLSSTYSTVGKGQPATIPHFSIQSPPPPLNPTNSFSYTDHLHLIPIIPFTPCPPHLPLFYKEKTKKVLRSVMVVVA